MSQQPLDIVHFDDEGFEFESSPTCALQHVDLERSFHELSPRATPRTMRRHSFDKGVFARR